MLILQLSKKNRWLMALMIVVTLAIVFYWYISTKSEREYSHSTYLANCAHCHGDNLKGVTGGTNLMAERLRFGDSTASLMQSILGQLDAHVSADAYPVFNSTQAKALALYIGEHREKYPSIKKSYFHSFSEQLVNSQYQRFRVEKFASLVSRPYSIAPLPDGRILVSEKVRGLSIVNKRGEQSVPIQSAPKAYDQFITVRGAYVGWGHFLDIALHPNYASNGWVYLAYADRCQLQCGSAVPQSMVKVVRARVRDGRWIDEETIWSVDKRYYTVVPDGVAGGRLAFDGKGYVYISIGGKAFYKHLHDMNTPYGKVHRVTDDGSVPQDNPFWLPEKQRDPTSTRHTVWTYGHRTIQGLTSNPRSGEIWSSEMGPRGGDEVNFIKGGGNYGWPLYTNGLDYDSSEISIGEDLGLDFPIEDTVLPVIDFTPAPALSNLTFYQGEQFPQWDNDILIGSLKALTLYRLRIHAGKLIEKETLATELGRIRDIEVGEDGLIYIATEHGDEGSILRLVPVD